MKTYSFITIAACLALAAAAKAHDVRSDITLSIGASGQAEIRPVRYDCGQSGPLSVTYVNADPNFLALVPVEGISRVFASAISASGSRYTADRYEWWSKGDEATLRDLTKGEDAGPVMTCKSAAGG